MENKLVDYLNTLHSYSGHNANVFAEKNVNNEFYKKLMVDVPICNFIIGQLTDEEPHIIMLTGHAGDGKTSLMYQTLEKMNRSFDSKRDKFEVTTPNGHDVLCIKDFSEFPDEEKLQLMRDSKMYQDSGKYVFMVANTGPLINAFVSMFPEDERNEIESRFLDALDANYGRIVEIGGYKVCLINIVNIDNSYFARNFLEKIINSNEWNECDKCEKVKYCHILRNVKLMKKNKNNTFSFIDKHYLWQNEYGNRLTIRSITQQLSFMFTGGISCKDVKDFEAYNYLYSNLFFGYVGTIVDYQALNIKAISDAYSYGYDQKKLRADEILFIKEDYRSLFSEQIESIIKNTLKWNGNISGIDKLIRRMYFFYNTNDDQNPNFEDIFSKQFVRYLQFKDGAEPNNEDYALVRSALNVIYTGIPKNNDPDIYITLNRETGYTQNVQYVIGKIRKNKVKLHKTELTQFGDNSQAKVELKLMVYDQDLKQTITLPLLDYFEDLKNGIISTNIDAQLSKGIENIKSEILDIVQDRSDDNDDLSLIILRGDSFKYVVFSISDDEID